MKIVNEFSISASDKEAWDILADLEQVVPLMPGARLIGRDGDDVVGKVKVKVGPLTTEFTGKVHFVERDEEHHRAVIEARGKETRGSGNVAATVTAQLHPDGDRTRVTVDTDLKIVGKLAQLGGGMLQQVSEKLLGEFVESLEAKLAGQESAAKTMPITEAEGPRLQVAQAEPAPIDLLKLTGASALRKYVPAALAALALLVLLVVSRRRHRG